MSYAPEKLPSFETELVNLESMEGVTDRISACGYIKHEVATMDDGEVYPVVTAVPSESRSDTAIVYSTAWLTSTRGHNRHTMLRMLKLGYPTIMIGPEGELRNPAHNRQERFQKVGSASLLKVSHDMNRILDEKLDKTDVRPSEIITLGESRGAMTGFGFDAPQYSGKRKVAYADLTAPCFARAAKIREVPGILAQLGPEAVTLSGLAFKLFGTRLSHYPATLHKDGEYYAKELLKIPKLMNGDAGRLAKAGRKNTQMHIRVFDDDSWSQADEWEEIFDNDVRPNVHVEHASGYHLAIAEPHTLNNIQARLNVLVEERGFDGSFKKVDFESVREALPPAKKRNLSLGRIAMRRPVAAST